MDKRETLRIKAENLFINNSETYKEEIKSSVVNSTVYRGNLTTNDSSISSFPKVICEMGTTESAIFKNVEESDIICALNFASFTRPGGGFITGAMAQEEALCHSSTLYNILTDKKFESEYKYNSSHTNDGFYENWAIYSPSVIFFKDEFECSCDIITCAAPNISRYKINGTAFDKKRYIDNLKKRLKFILDIATDNNVDTLVLGAFGCGVFGNEPRQVAKQFHELFNTGKYKFKKVIFSIPDKTNYEPFNKEFNSENTD